MGSRIDRVLDSLDHGLQRADDASYPTVSGEAAHALCWRCVSRPSTDSVTELCDECRHALQQPLPPDVIDPPEEWVEAFRSFLMLHAEVASFTRRLAVAVVDTFPVFRRYFDALDKVLAELHIAVLVPVDPGAAIELFGASIAGMAREAVAPVNVGYFLDDVIDTTRGSRLFVFRHNYVDASFGPILFPVEVPEAEPLVMAEVAQRFRWRPHANPLVEDLSNGFSS